MTLTMTMTKETIRHPLEGARQLEKRSTRTKNPATAGLRRRKKGNPTCSCDGSAGLYNLRSFMNGCIIALSSRPLPSHNHPSITPSLSRRAPLTRPPRPPTNSLAYSENTGTGAGRNPPDGHKIRRKEDAQPKRKHIASLSICSWSHKDTFGCTHARAWPPNQSSTPFNQSTNVSTNQPHNATLSWSPVTASSHAHITHSNGGRQMKTARSVTEEGLNKRTKKRRRESRRFSYRAKIEHVRAEGTSILNSLYLSNPPKKINRHKNRIIHHLQRSTPRRVQLVLP